MSDFKVGDRVCCIDAAGQEMYLTVGAIYTVIGLSHMSSNGIFIDDTGIKHKMRRFVLAAPATHVKHMSMKITLTNPKREDVDHRALLTFFSRCEAPNSCAKCGAPLPCRYHS